MKTNQNCQILIKLGTYSNLYVSGTHDYHNLIPEIKVTAYTTANMGEHEFEVYYWRVTRKQIKKAIQTGFNIIDPLNNMDYMYGDLIRQILAFICLAHHLNLIDDQEAETYLAKLKQINLNYNLITNPKGLEPELKISLGYPEIHTVKNTPEDFVYLIIY